MAFNQPLPRPSSQTFNRPTNVRACGDNGDLGNQNYSPRTLNPLVVPHTLVEQPQDIYDPSCIAPYRLQDAIPDGFCCQKKSVMSPRSMAQTLYNTSPNFHPQIYTTSIDNSLYGMDLSRWQTIAGTPIKVTQHFKAFLQKK